MTILYMSFFADPRDCCKQKNEFRDFFNTTRDLPSGSWKTPRFTIYTHFKGIFASPNFLFDKLGEGSLRGSFFFCFTPKKIHLKDVQNKKTWWKNNIDEQCQKKKRISHWWVIVVRFKLLLPVALLITILLVIFELYSYTIATLGYKD